MTAACPKRRRRFWKSERPAVPAHVGGEHADGRRVRWESFVRPRFGALASAELCALVCTCTSSPIVMAVCASPAQQSRYAGTRRRVHAPHDVRTVLQPLRPSRIGRAHAWTPASCYRATRREDRPRSHYIETYQGHSLADSSGVLDDVPTTSTTPANLLLDPLAKVSGSLKANIEALSRVAQPHVHVHVSCVAACRRCSPVPLQLSSSSSRSVSLLVVVLQISAPFACQRRHARLRLQSHLLHL